MVGIEVGVKDQWVCDGVSFRVGEVRGWVLIARGCSETPPPLDPAKSKVRPGGGSGDWASSRNLR